MINFSVLIKGAKFKVCMFSGFKRVELKKKAAKHKMACCILNKYCNIEKKSILGISFSISAE